MKLYILLIALIPIAAWIAYKARPPAEPPARLLIVANGTIHLSPGAYSSADLFEAVKAAEEQACANNPDCIFTIKGGRVEHSGKGFVFQSYDEPSETLPSTVALNERGAARPGDESDR